MLWHSWKGKVAYEGIVLEYLKEHPAMIWAFRFLLLAIQMMFSFTPVDKIVALKLCLNCYKAFFTENEGDIYCSGECAINRVNK